MTWVRTVAITYVNRGNSIALFEWSYVQAEKREKNLQQQRDEIARKKEEEFKQYSFHPKLKSTHYEKDPLRYGSKSKHASDNSKNYNSNYSSDKDVFHNLYHTKDVYRHSLEKKKQKIEAERANAYTGIPKIAPKSPKMAERRRQRRDSFAASSTAGYDSDSTLGYSSAGGGYYSYNRPAALSTDGSELDSNYGVPRTFAYMTPPQNADISGGGECGEDPDSHGGVYDPNLNEPFTATGYSPNVMSDVSLASPDLMRNFSDRTLFSALSAQTPPSYTGIEAPIVKRSIDGAEEKSTMSQSQRGRSIDRASANQQRVPMVHQQQQQQQPQQQQRVRSSSTGSVRSVRSSSSVGSVGVTSTASSRLELFDSLYQVRCLFKDLFF
jgi:hypothetical protein